VVRCRPASRIREPVPAKVRGWGGGGGGGLPLLDINLYGGRSPAKRGRAGGRLFGGILALPLEPQKVKI